MMIPLPFSCANSLILVHNSDPEADKFELTFIEMKMLTSSFNITIISNKQVNRGNNPS